MLFAGNALDELRLDDPLGLVDSIRETNSPISNSISAGLASSGLLGSSAPVNIPGMTDRSVLTNFSPSTSSPLQHLQSSSFLTGSRFSHQDSMESVGFTELIYTFIHFFIPFSLSYFDCLVLHAIEMQTKYVQLAGTNKNVNLKMRYLFQSMPFMNHVSDTFSNHISQMSSSASKIGSGFNSSLFDFANQGMSPLRTQQHPASPLVNAFSMSPNNSGSLSEVRHFLEQITRN